jgi:hypothetical protein
MPCLLLRLPLGEKGVLQQMMKHRGALQLRLLRGLIRVLIEGLIRSPLWLRVLQQEGTGKEQVMRWVEAPPTSASTPLSQLSFLGRAAGAWGGTVLLLLGGS